jgi:hypothetical protein
MKITNIQVTGRDGLKGQTFNHRVLGCVVFAGPMGTGKSTRLEAVLAGLRGLAEKPSDTSRPYVGPTRPRGIVSLLLEDGGRDRTIRRDLEKGATTKEAKTTDAEVSALCGAQVTRFDLRDFAEGTDSARRAVLDGVCRAAGVSGAWNRDTTLEWLGKALAEEETGALQRLLDARPLAGGVGDWLPGAMEWAREEFTTSNRDAKAAAGHATIALAADSDVPGGTLESAEARLAIADKGLAAARAAVHAAESAGKLAGQHEAAAERRAQAVKRATEERDDAAAAVKAAGLVEGPAVEALVERHAAAKAAAMQARAAVATTEAALQAATKAAAAAAGALSTAQGERAGLARMLEGATGCVHCGGADPYGLGADVARLDAEIEGLAVAAEDAGAALTLAQSRARRTEQAAREAAAAEGDARQAMHDAQETARNRKAQADAAKARLERAGAALAQAEADLVAADGAGAPAAFDAEAFAQLQAAVEAAELERAEAAADRDLHLRSQEREVAAQKAVAERERLDAVHAGIKALGLSLKELQGEVARAAYGPVVDAANAFLRECGIDIEVYINGEADFGAVLSPGWRPDSRPGHVVFWSLSGGERALVGAAFAVAFARLSGNAWRGLVLDELNHIDAVHLPRLIAGAGRMVESGQLFNFFGAFNAVSPPVFPGAEVVWLGVSA